MGTMIKASTMRITTWSYSPPMSADDTPKIVLNTRLIMPTPKPTSKEVLAP